MPARLPSLASSPQVHHQEDCKDWAARLNSPRFQNRCASCHAVLLLLLFLLLLLAGVLSA
jgi:hypothetical protein